MTFEEVDLEGEDGSAHDYGGDLTERRLQIDDGADYGDLKIR